MYSEILLRYGELSLKGKNKKIFINQLSANIEKIIGIKPATSFDRMFLPYNENYIEKLQYIFGISSFSPVIKINTDYEEIEKKVLEYFDNSKKTFKIIARRNWKNFEFNSDQINRKIATALFNKFQDLKVDVKNPENLISIEVRKEFTYIFLNSQKGLGGLPVGVSGKVLHLISGGIDSPVAAYLMMKRGVKIDFLSFITPPQTDEKTVEKVNKIISLLNKFQGTTILYQINYSTLMNYIGLTSNQSYKINLMRRSFYRIASHIAQQNNYLGLSNGENLAQVASQTLESMDVIGQQSKFQIYRPLLTYDKVETINIAEKIGTYQISIEKANEACEIFAPQKPVIKPGLKTAENLEQELNLLKQMEKETISKNLKVKKFKI
ncbi:tRNA 4-thiouridine(8) synthase ThiI [Mycoplasma iguanae]|uniref:Probable tRNA sulfurtransferase n=1 Tax=Mycoplasma iguanae TaxID=292461 RepID=A0ABY5RA31_9MOLU|nr:tRNA uracil 4-sulfurtransferase ThiI [Mycoplasma iguanae]UVD81622.1 tRNA 4-thiouridine(8) synthase ThiI [Mycoplasma iguanae]